MANNPYIGIDMGLDIQDLRTGLSEAKREIALAESEFKARTAGLDKWSESIDGLTAKLDQLGKELAAKAKVVDAYRNELQRVTDAYGANSKQAQEVQTKLNNAEASYTKAQKYTEELKKKLNDLQSAEKSAGTAADNLKTSVTSAGSAAKTASTKIKDSLAAALEKAKDAAEKAAKDGFDTLKSKVSGFVTGALSKATNALKDFIKQTIQLGIDFSSTMSTVQALSGASAEEMAVMEKAARDAGASTTFSATEAAEALKYMSLAGWDATQSTEALGGILDLAAASGMGLAEASDAVTDYLTAFGLEAKDSAKFADMLAYAQANANLSADQLIASYKNAAPTLASAGQSVETVTATLAVLSNAGIKGGEAGTALAAVMRDITKRMKDGAVQIGATSVKVADQEGNFRSLTDILGDVAGAVDGLGTAERSQALSATFTADSIKAVNTLLNAGTGEVGKYEEALKASDGAAKEMAKTMNDNLGGDIKQLNSVLDEIKLALFDLIEGPLREIVKALTELLKHSGTVTDGIAKGFGNVTTKFEGASKGIDALVNADWDGIGKGAEDAWNGMTEAFAGVGQWASGIFDSIQGVFKDPGNALQEAGGKMWQHLKDGWTNIAGWASGVLGTINSALGDPAGTISATGSKLWGKLTGAFSGVGGWFTANVYNPMTGAFNGLATWASNTFGGVWSAISNAFSPVVGFFTNIYNGIMKAISPVLQFFGIKTDGYDPLAGIKQQITDSEAEVKRLKGIYDTAYADYQTKRSTYGYGNALTDQAFKTSNAAYTAWNTARQELVKLQNSLKDAEQSQKSGGLGDVSQSISSAFSGVKDAITKPFTDAWNTITGLFGGIGSWFEENVIKPLQKLLNPVGEAVSNGLVGGMVDAKQSITTGTQTLGGWIVGGLCDVLGIHSPSKVMREKVGAMIGEGVALGIADSTRTALQAAEGLGRDLTSAMSVKGPAGASAGHGAPAATVVYNQTINSPDPLTAGQIYRDTRSLLGRREWA